MTNQVKISSKLVLLVANALSFWGVLHTASAQAGPPIPQSSNRVFDYVIVGAGPGGLVTASRLSEDPNVSVAVIEAGTWAEDVVGNWSEIPAYNYNFDLKVSTSEYSGADWGFVSTPQPGMNGHVIRYPRGKTLGGSTNLNSMAWGHSTKGAFQKWADLVGDNAYTYENVARYYRKAMKFTPPDLSTRFENATPSYNPALVSTNGLLDVSYAAYSYSFTTWVAKAMQAVGIKNTNSFINGALNGSAYHMNTVNHKTGFRGSADKGYLRPYLNRPNLAVFDLTLAEQIIFDKKKVATGVKVTKDGTSYVLNARKEVIVSGGAFQTPHLLQLSGVGPKALLNQYKIPVVADLPGVGQNLQDHIFFGITYRVNVPTSSTLGANLAEDIKLFNTNATGRLTNPGGEYAGFENIPNDLRKGLSASTLKALANFPEDWPEIEYLALPSFVGDLETAPPTDGYNYATILATLMTPTSRGNVSISSTKMSDQPVINGNWLTSKEDIEVSIAMFKRLRQIWTVPELSPLTIGEEYWPGKSVQTDAQIEQLIRSSMTPVSHVTSSCKMGKKSDNLAVVDTHGKVYGVKNLRIIDASIFPFLTPGPAPQAAVYMLAEKIADDIKKGN